MMKSESLLSSNSKYGRIYQNDNKSDKKNNDGFVLPLPADS